MEVYIVFGEARLPSADKKKADEMLLLTGAFYVRKEAETYVENALEDLKRLYGNFIEIHTEEENSKRITTTIKNPIEDTTMCRVCIAETTIK